MIWKKTLTSAIIFALLAGLYTADQLWTQHRKETKELTERAFPIKEADVNELTLVTPFEIITAKRESGDRWRMTQPIDAPADKDTIQVILSNVLPAMRYEEFTIDPNIHIADYGLDAPAYKLIVKTKANEKEKSRTATLLVGKQAAVSGKFFAKLEDENKIFSINEHIKNNLDKRPFELRDRSLLPVSDKNVESLTIQRNIEQPLEMEKGTTKTVIGSQVREERVVLARKDGTWRILEPTPWKADSAEVENFLRTLRTQKVASFVDQPTTGASYGFDKPKIYIEVRQLTAAEGVTSGTAATTQTETLALSVGDRATSPMADYFAKRSDQTIVRINPAAFDALNVRATKFRDKQLFDLAVPDVDSFTIDAGKSRVRLAREPEGRWVFPDDVATTVDQQIVNEKLSELLNVRARDFETEAPTDLAQYRLDKPFVRLTVASAAKKTSQTLAMGKLTTQTLPGEDRPGVFAQMSNTPAVILLDYRQPSEFALSKDQLMDKSLFAFSPGDVTQIDVQRGTSAPFTLLRDGNVWRLQSTTATAARRVQEYLPGDIVRGVRELKYAMEYKGPLTQSEMGLTTPTLQIVLRNAQKAEIARVVRGIEKGGHYYAEIQRGGRIFGIDSAQFRPIDSAIEGILKE